MIVLRPSGKPTMAALLVLARQAVAAVSVEAVQGRLWVVEAGRIRVHESAEQGPSTKAEE